MSPAAPGANFDPAARGDVTPQQPGKSSAPNHSVPTVAAGERRDGTALSVRSREVGRTWCAAVTSRLRLGLVAVSGAALTLTLFTGPQAVPAAADPPLTVADAKAKIEQLEVDAEALDQDYAGVQEQIEASLAKLKRKEADAKDQAVKLKKMKAQVGQVALAQFQNRSLDTAAQLFLTEDTQGFLNQISTVEIWFRKPWVSSVRKS